VSGAADPFGELGLLAAALCDGEITLAEAARLEQLARQSPEARRLLLQYVQLHGELYWDMAAGARPATDPATGASASVARETRRKAAWRAAPRSWIAAALAASFLVALAWWALAPRNAPQGGAEKPAVVAQLGRTFEAEWATIEGPMSENSAFSAGKKLELRSGLAEIVFRSGARVVLQGPATLDLLNSRAGAIHAGRIAVKVPRQATGFTLHTRGVTVTDLGTEFGLAIDEGNPQPNGWGPVEIHAFVGEIQLQWEGAFDSVAQCRLRSGEAVRISRIADSGPVVDRLAAAPGRFVRSLPESRRGSVAAMRRLVSGHPRLIHHYTFEGLTPLERYRDSKGELHLIETIMSNGRDNGTPRIQGAAKHGRRDGVLSSGIAGFDATTCAVAPYRASVAGNSTGVALQSEAAFRPPPELTVEVLLKARPPEGHPKAPICVALATRENSQRSSFFLAAVDHCQLTHLMDADAPWVETEGDFACAADQWYYLASTFRVESGRTRINTYVADLTRGERTLNWIVKDRLAPGVPGTSRLGVGKGFDENGAHAYPWSGDLDEVALYDAILDRDALEQHLLAILPATSDPEM